MKVLDLVTRTVFAVLAICCMAATADGGDEKPPEKIILYPAAGPRPALKYQLLPPFMERIRGNAAVYYGKVTAEQAVFFGDRETSDKISRWQEAPLDELRKEDVRPVLGPGSLESIEYFLDRAARCEYCDWQLPIREEVFFNIVLPDVQQTREFARILGAKARMHIARGEFDEAVKTFQIGFATGRHVAAGETLINGLVGLAVSGIMSRQALEFVQQRDAPNLYWALTMLPRPLIDMRTGVEAEMNAIALSFPDVRDLETARRSPEEWRESLLRFWQQVIAFVDRSEIKARPEILTAACLRGYPVAKRALVERGLSPEVVEAMPVAQVVMLHTMRTYEELRDEMFKWSFVPYSQAAGGPQAALEFDRIRREQREIVPLAAIFLPAVESLTAAFIRADRDIAVLRVLEAMRIHGAATGGKLPEKLSDITQVPIPVDPVTDRPFEYRREGNTAHLLGPPLPGHPLNYEITMRGE